MLLVYSHGASADRSRKGLFSLSINNMKLLWRYMSPSSPVASRGKEGEGQALPAAAVGHVKKDLLPVTPLLSSPGQVCRQLVDPGRVTTEWGRIPQAEEPQARWPGCCGSLQLCQAVMYVPQLE